MKVNFKDRVKKECEFSRVNELYHNKKFQACIKFSTQYLEKYGPDVQILFIRAISYRKQHNIEAEINDLVSILSIELYNLRALTELFYVYHHENRFEEAMEILNLILSDYMKIPDDFDIEPLEKAKHILKTAEILKIVDIPYTKFEIVSGIVRKHVEFADEPKKDDTSYFYHNIDINYLYDVVKEALKTSNKANVNTSYDHYYFAIPNVGCNDNEVFNFIRVIVVPGTDEIVTMYPTNEIDDKNYQFLDIDVKRLRHFKEKALSD